MEKWQEEENKIKSWSQIYHKLLAELHTDYVYNALSKGMAYFIVSRHMCNTKKPVNEDLP